MQYNRTGIPKFKEKNNKPEYGKYFWWGLAVLILLIWLLS